MTKARAVVLALVVTALACNAEPPPETVQPLGCQRSEPDPLYCYNPCLDPRVRLSFGREHPGTCWPLDAAAPVK